MTTYETYPGAEPGAVDHGIIVTMVDQSGQQVTVFGPFTEARALVELSNFAVAGTTSIDVSNALVMRVSDREILVVHDSFFSKWTARAVIGTYVKGAP